MAKDVFDRLRHEPLYISRTDRANENKSPSKSTPMGTMAEVRYPNAANRSDLISGILNQGKNLVQGSFGKLYYKPVTIIRIDLKLEPV